MERYNHRKTDAWKNSPEGIIACDEKRLIAPALQAYELIRDIPAVPLKPVSRNSSMEFIRNACLKARAAITDAEAYSWWYNIDGEIRELWAGEFECG